MTSFSHLYLNFYLSIVIFLYKLSIYYRLYKSLYFKVNALESRSHVIFLYSIRHNNISWRQHDPHDTSTPKACGGRNHTPPGLTVLSRQTIGRIENWTSVGLREPSGNGEGEPERSRPSSLMRCEETGIGTENESSGDCDSVDVGT